MDPAAAVCCPMEHGHILYTQIQMVQKHMRCVCCWSRSISQGVKERVPTLTQEYFDLFFLHYFFCLYSNFC